MPRQPKRFKVIGTQPILDHQPGETFEAVIPQDHAEFLISIGGLEEVKDPPKDKSGESPKRR